jgi:hypothetical protein
MNDTLPFAVQITADGKYLNIRLPVSHLPPELRKSPSRMNVRLLPERMDTRRAPRWLPPFLLALKV